MTRRTGIRPPDGPRRHPIPACPESAPLPDPDPVADPASVPATSADLVGEAEPGQLGATGRRIDPGCPTRRRSRRPSRRRRGRPSSGWRATPAPAGPARRSTSAAWAPSPVEPIMRVAGGMASVRKSTDRASGSRPSANRVQPRSSAGVPDAGDVAAKGRVAGSSRRSSTSMIPTWTPVGIFGVRRTHSSGSAAWKGGGAVVADGGLLGKVTEDEHGVDHVGVLRRVPHARGPPCARCAAVSSAPWRDRASGARR